MTAISQFPANSFHIPGSVDAGLIDAFSGNLEDLHSIELAEADFAVYLDDAVSTSVDSQPLHRGISRLSRAQ
jgi:hypothetical protein